MNFLNVSELAEKENFSFILPPQEVHVWLVSTEDSISGILSALEQAHAETLSSPSVRERFECSRRPLRSLLSRYLSVAPEALVFETTADGKPFVLGFPEISFSMAHSESLIAYAFSRAPVGIDLEQARKVKALAVAEKFFSLEELAFLKEKETEERFFQLWTAKEAALKADGRGITKGLRQAYSVFEKNSITTLQLEEKNWAITSWFLKMETGTKILGAVASFSPLALIRWYDLRSAVTLTD